MAGSGTPIRFRVKVVPRSSVTGVRGRMADGTVKISLRAPPADGKANEELIRFLASEFSVPRSSVELLSGATSRRKLISVDPSGSTPHWLEE